jgi:DNA-binding NarL/FixJ family response regulator
MGVIEDLARAREAYERREWVAAYEALSGPGEQAFAADDFFRLAMSANLLGRHNDCVQALQRAHQLHLDAGEDLAALRCGFWLAMTLLSHGETAVGNGWVASCKRLLETVDRDVVERGYVLTLELFQRIFSGQFTDTLELAEQVVAFGRRFDDPDLLVTGLNAQGRMLVYAGRVREGIALLDEAMIGVSTGRVSPIFAGETYCSLVEACQEISDVGRMAEWTSALSRWVDAQPGLVRFTGQCAVHRGQIMRFRGRYAAALAELRLAVDRYRAHGHLAPAGLALAEQGDVLRLTGEMQQAQDCYGQAMELGHEPQPGLALLRLAQGHVDAATAAARRLVAEPRDPVHRSQLLPASVEILLAAGDDTAAGGLADELVVTSEAFGCRALAAMGLQARAAVSLAREDPAAALTDLRAALHDWLALEAPYHQARCRTGIGLALRALEDEESATDELAAALALFRDIGARPDAEHVARLVANVPPGGLTPREVEVLRLVASGLSNPEIAARLVLSEKTVGRHLSNIFTKLDVTSRTAAAAFAFEHRLV